jgi:hypothetical protein
MRKFVENVRANLKLAGSADDDAAVWRILRRFHILVFDFNQPGSASTLLANDRCRMILLPEDASRAASLWNTVAAPRGTDARRIQAKRVKAVKRSRSMVVEIKSTNTAA